MEKINVLTESFYVKFLNAELANIEVTGKSLSDNINKLSKSTIAFFNNDETDFVLFGYALSTGIKIFMAGYEPDIKEAFPDVVMGSFDDIIKAVNTEIQIQFDYESVEYVDGVY